MVVGVSDDTILTPQRKSVSILLPPSGAGAMGRALGGVGKHLERQLQTVCLPFGVSSSGADFSNCKGRDTGASSD